ncbi:MAG: C25 family cysteine peptidase [bacterium]
MSRILLTLLPAVLLAGSYSHDVSFSPAELRFSRAGGWDVVELARGIVIDAPGLPSLPVVPVTLVIPADARVTSVEVEVLDAGPVDGRWRIAPIEEPRPLSGRAQPAPVPPDPSVYESAADWPAAPLADWRAGRASGFQLVSVLAAPLSWRPADGRLTLNRGLRISVQWDAAAPAPALSPSQRERAADGLRALVANPDWLESWSPPAAGRDLPEINYLVITGDRFAEAFRPFVEYRTARGLRAEVRTVEWVSGRYPGRDLQEQTRNLIRDYYENRGLSYVLLAGDNAVVPCRRIRARVGSEVGDIPTDLYYADLDHSWDSNNNNIFGEPADSVDFYSDVIVGRASVDNETQVANFIAKVFAYENDPAPDYIRRGLFPSGWLWHSIGYHGRFVHDSIINLLPNGWTNAQLVNPASAAVVADSFNRGYAVFDAAGHGNEGGVYDETGPAIYTSSYAGRQTNSRKFSIMTSLACTPGNFEAEDCIAEISHNCPDGGTIAVMMNSRYGWGTPPAMGPSEKLCIRFYDQWLIEGENVLGVAHARGLEVYAGAARYDQLWRWCMTEFNLFGDPAIDLWTTPPRPLAVSADSVLPTGAGIITARVSDLDGPVGGAFVCAWKDNEVHATARTNSSGEAPLVVHPVTTGRLVITASAHDFLAEACTARVTEGEPEPLLVYASAQVSDAGQPRENGILEPGENGALTLVVRNLGRADAPDARVLIRALSPGLSATDSTAELGLVGAGDSAATSDLAVRAAPDIRPGSRVELYAIATSGSWTWDFCFTIPVGHPGRVAAEVDTGACALTLTARGNLGFDNADSRRGRGFRFPKDDTSCLNIASFVLGNSADYVADRFYNLSALDLDRDWVMRESLYSEAPRWTGRQVIRGAFTDAGHPRASGIRVVERALGTDEGEAARFVVLVYDIINDGSSPLGGARTGIFADFDIRATDRFHDLARVFPADRAAAMRSINPASIFAGVRLLHPDLPGRFVAFEHDRYVYPDSGLSEEMKYRLLRGELGTVEPDRVHNWSVAVATGSFDLVPGERQRVAFAFLAAPDSTGFLDACEDAQRWYDLNVGVSEGTLTAAPARHSIGPSPFGRLLTISLGPAVVGPVRVDAWDASGRLVARIHDGPVPAGGRIDWRPTGLPAGVYLLRISTAGSTVSERVVLAR